MRTRPFARAARAAGVALTVAVMAVATVAPAAVATPKPTTPPAAPVTLPGTAAEVGRPGAPAIAAKAWILVDAATGEVLSGHAIHDPQLTASTVKVVTALTALRLVGPNANIAMTPNGASRTPMKLGIPAGQTWPMKEMLYAMLLVSANDVAYSLAEQSAGSLSAFAKAMTDTGRKLGVVDGHFQDPAGLDGADSLIGPSTMSAFDLAAVGRAALADPTLAPIVGTAVHDLVGPDGITHHLVNHNKALTRYQGSIGIKTGFTRAASGTYLTAATRNGRTYVVALLGTAGEIYGPAATLFEWAFAQPATAPTTTAPAVAAATDAPTSVAALPVAPSIESMGGVDGVRPAVAIDGAGTGNGAGGGGGNQSATRSAAGSNVAAPASLRGAGSSSGVPPLALLLVLMVALGGGGILWRRRAAQQRKALAQVDRHLGGLLLLEPPEH